MTDTGFSRRARRTRPDQPRTYRLATSVRLPFAVGLVSLLLVGTATAFLVGDERQEAGVPGGIFDYQESITREAAQSIRRGVNEGVSDVDQLARSIGAVDGRSGLTGLLRPLEDTHGRYRSVYLLGDDGEVLANVGDDPDPDLLDEDDAFDVAGMTDALEVDRRPVIVQYAPLPDDERVAIVGEYDHEFLRFAMEVARPGDAWLVNEDGRIISALGGFSPFAELPRRSLRDAADRATGGESGAELVGGGIGSQEIIGWAPVSGPGPSGDLGWAVVTERRVSSVSLPATDSRREAVVAGIVTAALAIVVFGWLWLVLIRPLLKLQREAERLAYGDLAKPVEIERYDEIGLIARSMERIRVQLIRRRVQGDRRP